MMISLDLYFRIVLGTITFMKFFRNFVFYSYLLLCKYTYYFCYMPSCPVLEFDIICLIALQVSSHETLIYRLLNILSNYLLLFLSSCFSLSLSVFFSLSISLSLSLSHTLSLCLSHSLSHSLSLSLSHSFYLSLCYSLTLYLSLSHSMSLSLSLSLTLSLLLCISLTLSLSLADLNNTANHLPYHFVMIYILPAIFTAGVATTGTEFGYLDASSAICSISSHNYHDVYFFYIPMVIFNLVGLIAGMIKAHCLVEKERCGRRAK